MIDPHKKIQEDFQNELLKDFPERTPVNFPKEISIGFSETNSEGFFYWNIGVILKQNPGGHQKEVLIAKRTFGDSHSVSQCSSTNYTKS